MSDIERRMLCKEVRAEAGTDGKPLIRGYAAVFNQLSEDLGGFREQLATGAFSDAMANSDVRALVNHDPNMVLGRNKAGTLTMREDAAGLYVEITPPDTQAARDLVTSMQRGDINQMSFAFTVAREDQTWTRDGTGPWLRTIKKVSRLYDVSVVTYPAYQQTTAAARALAEHQAEDDGAKAALAAAQAEEQRQIDSRKRHLRLLELSA